MIERSCFENAALVLKFPVKNIYTGNLSQANFNLFFSIALAFYLAWPQKLLS